MDFDQLVRKYLTATLTDAEMEHFRSLLERVPEYRTELRQILELRSLIHDDALTLTPPEDLSEQVRQGVAERFAAPNPSAIIQADASSLEPPVDLSERVRLAVAARFAEDAPVVIEQKKRRRGLILPLRLAASTLAAVSLVVTVALTPEVRSIAPSLFPSALDAAHGSATIGESNAATATAATPATEASSIVAPRSSGTSPRLSASTPARRTFAGSSDRSSSVTESPAADPFAIVPASIDEARLDGIDIVLPEIAPAPPAATDAPTTPPVSKAIAHGQPDILNHTLATLLGAKTVMPTPLAVPYHPAPDTTTGHSIASHTHTLLPQNTALASNDGRRLSFGLTLGSGGIVDGNVAALVQNSYYFSFSISENDRIGMEMGGSSVMQVKMVAVTGNGGSSAFAKGGSSDGSDEGSSSTGGTNTLTDDAPLKTVATNVQKDLTYGGVFYDRRISIGKKWDICGRATVGGADNSLVTSLRAYAAFTPARNVSLTVGVGGTAMYDITSKKSRGSGNYGVYYGLEAGF